MSRLVISYVLITDLLPAIRNARRHSRKQIRQLARSIEEFGFKIPIVCTRDQRIVSGHGRYEAALLLGMAEVPVIYIDDLTPEQVRLFAVADNQLHDLSSFSEDALKLEFRELLGLGVELDLTVTGFDTGTLDLLLDDDGRDPNTVEPPIPPLKERAVARPGDIFAVGPHRIACGDAREDRIYDALLFGQRAQMVVADFPYNVRIDGHVSGTGSVHHREFTMASGEMSREEFTIFLADTMKPLTRFSSDGSVHYLFMDFRHMGEMLDAAEGHYSELMNLCVWAKGNAGMGSLYRSQHELVFVYKSGKARHVNNVELGKHGRNRTNVWRYRGMNSFGKGRDEALAAHPTVKPVDLIADAILDCSERESIVLDPFLGSGTTILAAEKTCRRGYGIELDPLYVDIALERASKAVGVPPILIATGQTFADVAAERASNQGGDR
jgi:DNA modification methylase